MKYQEDSPIEPKKKSFTKIEKKYAQKLRDRKVINYLTSLLQKIEQWWPRYSLAHPDEKLEEMIQSIRDKRDNLINAENKLRQEKHVVSEWDVQRFISPPIRTYSESMNRRMAEYRAPEIPFNLFFQPQCPATSGIAHPASVMTYKWALPVRSETFSPLIFSGSNISDQTLFEGEFYTVGGFPFSYIDSNAALHVLQVPFPAPLCDVTLIYSTHVDIGLPQGCFVMDDWGFWDIKDFGYLDIDYALHEQPNGGIFPDFLTFDWYPGIHYNRTVRDYIWDSRLFRGRFPVNAGVTSNLYIGISIEFMGADCHVMIGQPSYELIGSGRQVGAPAPGSYGYFNLRLPESSPTPFDYYGVYYEMVPR